MDLAGWLYKHRKKIKLWAILSLVIESLDMISRVYFGEFVWFDGDFWGFIQSLIFWVIVNIQYGEDEE